MFSRRRDVEAAMFDETITELEPVEQFQTGPKTILIVDDDPDQTELLSDGLASQGYETLVASTGCDALDLARSQQPHLVLLDLGLPDTDGFEICRELADDQATTAIPVIIVSGEELADILRRARAAGSQYYVRKPYDPNALLVLIECALASGEPW
jgi:DNA-binding response OmpR family regulator